MRIVWLFSLSDTHIKHIKQLGITYSVEYKFIINMYIAIDHFIEALRAATAVG